MSFSRSRSRSPRHALPECEAIHIALRVPTGDVATTVRELDARLTNGDEVASLIPDVAAIARALHGKLNVDNADRRLEAATDLRELVDRFQAARAAEAVLHAGIVATIVALIPNATAELREQALWTLGCVARESPMYRNSILQQGALTPILQILEHDSDATFIYRVGWTLVSFSRGKPGVDLDIIKPALPTIAKFLHHSNENVVAEACRALSHITDGANDKIAAVLESDVSFRLIELLGRSSKEIVEPALRTVGNLVMGDDAQTQVVLQCGVLPALSTLLRHEDWKIQRDACWAISSIVAGNREQIQAVIDSNLVPIIIGLLQNAACTAGVKKEAMWVVCNIISGGSSQQRLALIEFGCIDCLLDILDSRDLGLDGMRSLALALEALEQLLRMGQRQCEEDGVPDEIHQLVDLSGGAGAICDLKEHVNEEIAERATSILEEFFNEYAESANTKARDVVVTLGLTENKQALIAITLSGVSLRFDLGSEVLTFRALKLRLAKSTGFRVSSLRLATVEGRLLCPTRADLQKPVLSDLQGDRRGHCCICSAWFPSS